MIEKKFLIFITAVLLIAGCRNKENEPMLPAVSGKPGNLVIVVDKADWDTKAGEVLRNLFERPYEVLPQFEPVFDVSNVPHSGLSSVVKSQRNILMINISPKNKEPRIIAQKDLWAKPQLVVSVYAENDSAFTKLMRENDEKVISLFEDMERKRMMEIFRSNIDRDIYENIEEKFSARMLIPKGYKINADTTGFMWLSNEYNDIVLSLMIYQYDYTDTATFTKDYLINKRNYYASKYIHGEVPGSYMTTETEYGPFMSTYMLRGDRYVAELRGLWKMVNGIAMGGPFISLTTLDEKRNKVLTVEGFVFAAGHDKRNYLRQVEAIVLSLEVNK